MCSLVPRCYCEFNFQDSDELFASTGYMYGCARNAARIKVR